MSRLFAAALVVLGFVPSLSSALEIKNIRPCYGPLGPTRFDAKCLPGDVLFFTYEIDGLALDPKTKKFSYDTILELLDAKDNVLFKNLTATEVNPQLGGTTMPGDLQIVINEQQKPGKYKIQVTIKDKIGKSTKAFAYAYDVIPESFGFIRVAALALGVPGQSHVLCFSLGNLTLDGKTKMPDAEVTIRILDEKMKPVSEHVKILLPRDMPDGADLQKSNIVPLTFPLFLNRVGRYNIEMLANDKNGNKKVELRYPLTVRDVSTFADK